MSQGRKIEAVICADEKITYRVGEPVLECGLQDAAGVKVKEIGQHEPLGPGDCWFYVIMFEDGSQVQVFNMDRVILSKPVSIMPVTQKLIV